MSNLIPGFGFVFFAAMCGGAFGLQYRVMRKYTVENSALLTMLFATIIVPLIAIHFILPGWTSAILAVGWKRNFLVYVLGFGWGMGAITFAYSYNILGMALASAVLQGINLTVGVGVPLIRHWNEAPANAKGVTIVGLLLLLLGAALAGKAGRMREKEHRTTLDDAHAKQENYAVVVHKATGIVFVIGLASCVVSGVLSACALIICSPQRGRIRKSILQGLNT